VRRVLELEAQVRALQAERDALREAVAQLGETVAHLERRWAQRQEP
jgi:phage shock protein A